MRKIVLFLMALLLTGFSVTYADVQLDKGQLQSTAAQVWFVARNARTCDNPVADNCGRNGSLVEISASRVVVWDSASDDGVSVRYSSNSGDPLVAGITLDRIPGSSRDTSVTADDNHNNWGRVLTWGRVSDVSYDGNAQSLLGDRVMVGVGKNADLDGPVAGFGFTSADLTIGVDEGDRDPLASRDTFAVFLDNPATDDATVDIFVRIT